MMYWNDELTPHQLQRLASFVRNYVVQEEGVQKESTDDELLRNLKHNVISGGSIQKIRARGITKHAYNGSNRFPPDFFREEFDYPQEPLFGGNPPPDHPLPEFFAANRPHISFLSNSIRICELKPMHEEGELIKNLAMDVCNLMISQPHLDPELYVDGIRVPLGIQVPMGTPVVSIVSMVSMGIQDGTSETDDHGSV